MENRTDAIMSETVENAPGLAQDTPEATETSNPSTEAPESQGGAPSGLPCDPGFDGEIEIDEAALLAKAEALDEIVAQGKLVDELKRQTEAAQNAYKAKKNEWEAQVNRLTSLIRKSTERLPLFDKKPAATVEAGDEEEAWREEPLAQLANHGLSDSVIKALDDAEILTFGQLTDWTKTGNRKTEDIPGIGPARAEQIADATAACWEAWAAEQRRQLDAIALEGAKAAEAAKEAEAAEDPPAKEVHKAEDSGGPEVIEAKKGRRRKAS